MKYSYRNLAYFFIIMILFIKSWNYFLFYRLKSVENFRGKEISLYKPSRLRVLTLNVYLRPPMISHCHSDFKDERTQIISKIFKYFDVVLLQEVHTCLNFRCNDLINNAAKQGLTYHYCSYGPSILSRYLSNNGLLILSRFPIISSDYISFHNCRSYDTIIEKGCNYIKIQGSSGFPIHIFNTHLQSSYQKIDPICGQIRQCQLKQLVEFINVKCDLEKDAVICGGDFNINSFDKLEYNYLTSVLKDFTDPFENSDQHTILVPYDLEDKEDNSFCTVCQKCLKSATCKLDKQRLDYLFYNHKNKKIKYKTGKILPFEIKTSEVDFTNLSDHFGLYVEFTY